MAFFKFRKGGDEQPAPVPAPESVEAMRRRARHRLIGAAVLVGLGVIGFPLLFDSQPRPISVDIPIEIPDKNKVKPLGNLPMAAPAAQAAGSIETEPAPAVPAASAPVSAPVVAPGVPAAPVAAARIVAGSIAAPAPVASKPLAKAADKPAMAAVTKPDDGSKAQALLEGKDADKVPAAAAAPRFVVQVGAFADVVKAREARVKLEKSGLKTYTQVVESKEGRRIRVRIGPFESKHEADMAAERIKKLDLPAAILEL